MSKFKRESMWINGEEVYPLSEEEYKELYKKQIKAYEESWNNMDKDRQLSMIMYACNRYGEGWIRIAYPDGLSNQIWFTDDEQRWKNEAMKEYIDDN